MANMKIISMVDAEVKQASSVLADRVQVILSTLNVELMQLRRRVEKLEEGRQSPVSSG